MTIFGLEPQRPLPDKWTPLEAVTVIKCLDEEGETALYLSSTAGLTEWEALGMLSAGVATKTDALREMFQPEGEDEG